VEFGEELAGWLFLVVKCINHQWQRCKIKVHALNFVSGRVRDTWPSYASISCMYVVRSNYDTNLDFVVYLLHLYVQMCTPLKYSMKMLEEKTYRGVQKDGCT
jgi:hypothetical protein